MASLLGKTIAIAALSPEPTFGRCGHLGKEIRQEGAARALQGLEATGLSYNAAEISAKRVQLLQEAVAGLSRVAVLWNSTLKAMALGFQQIEVAAPSLGVTVQSVRVSSSADFDQAFAAIGKGGPAESSSSTVP